MKKLLFVLLAGMLMLAGCGGRNGNKSGKAPKGNDGNSAELSTKEVSAKLCEINDWYVTDTWNVGLCGIGYYISSDTSATGEELDVELTLKQYNEATTKLEEYNTLANELRDRKYNDVKFAWEKLYKGIRESDKIVQSNEIRAKPGLDLKANKLSRYQTTPQRYINTLSKS